jgi:1,2-diacylglycerol 3-alpha-glucosyltransferase
MPKYLIYWPYFLHYHIARIKAVRDLLANNQIELVVLALSRKSEDLHNALVLDQECVKVHYIEDSIGLGDEPTDKLYELLRQISPDCVFVNGYGDVVCRQLSYFCRINTIPLVVFSDSKADDARRRLLKEWGKRQYVSDFDSAVVAGVHASRYLCSLGLPAERQFMPYDVVDNDFWSATDAGPQAACGYNNYFLSIGRFVPKKRFRFLVQAYAELVRSCEGAVPHLVIIGDGPERESIAADIHAVGLTDSVHLLGYCNPEALRGWYRGACAFVIASNEKEQWGLVVNEAVAAGVPVLASCRIGCVPDLIEHGKTGYTFDPYDVTSLRTALAWFMKSGQEARAYAGAASERLCRRYACADFAQAILASARAAVDHQRKRRRSLINAILRRALYALDRIVWASEHRKTAEARPSAGSRRDAAR